MTTISTRTISVSQLAPWAARGQLFAILDATDAPAVPERAESLGESRAISLYRGRAEEDLSAIAPYLVQLDWATLEWITSTLWSEPWGVLVLTNVPLESLRTHFRRFLVVNSPEGEAWYFRYYDPRVLGRYLETCLPEEVTDFFGPVIAYGVTDHETYGVALQFVGDGPAIAEQAVPSSAVLA